MNPQDIKGFLRSRATTGLDLSPGDEISKRALGYIESLELENAHLRSALQEISLGIGSTHAADKAHWALQGPRDA